MDNFLMLLDQLKQPILITLVIIAAILIVLYLLSKTKENFFLMLKILLVGIIPIVVSGGVCALIIIKFANGHPHGLPGILNILLSGLALSIWVAIVLILAFLKRHSLNFAVRIAFIIAALQTLVSLLLEL